MHGAAATAAGDGGRKAPARPGQQGDRDDADRPARAFDEAAPEGPVIILYGLEPRAAALAVSRVREAL